MNKKKTTKINQPTKKEKAMLKTMTIAVLKSKMERKND